MIKENAAVHKELDLAEATLVDRLAAVVGAKTGAVLVYGEAVSQGNVTVIPVAKVRYGFGGGFGHHGKSGDEGGGGGGVIINPIGYIELKDGTSQFRPIQDPAQIARMMMAGGTLAYMLLLRPLFKHKR
ncbi:MAG TPA: spore germination protein GerW family protein [Fimbriimonadaceae bacterium]|jgi:uncharacterized spore protein YtfJ